MAKKIDRQISADRKAKAIQQKHKSTEKKYHAILDQNQELKSTINTLKKLKNNVLHYEIKETKTVVSEATMIVLASDWHLGEVVIPSSVNHLNTHDKVIAKKRAEEFFVNVVKLYNMFSRDITINSMVLALLGDFINNMIHEEAQEGNSMLPTHEVLFAQKILISGIQYILDNTELKLIVPCHSGNHGRTTKSQHHGHGDTGHSLEYLMYHAIASHFENNNRITFMIAESYHTYLKVYDYNLCFHHGHAIRYAGGIGGITIPVNKAIAQWNKAKQADIHFFGHFHQMFDGGNFICNGSQIGWNAYAISIKASYEKPKQVVCLIDKVRGKTIVAPIVYTT